MPDLDVIHGDSLDVMRSMPADSVDAVVTDPPYGLEFMGKEWDAPYRQSGSEWAQKRATGTDWKGRERERPGRLYMRSRHETCRTCGRQKHQHRDDCMTPDFVWVTHEPVQMRAFQAWCEEWAREALRVLKPGGHLVAFGGTRTYHRLTCGLEDAGFEIRDCLSWLYGSGFPKSLDVSKAIDKAARGVPQGGADPTSPNHGRYRTQATEGKRGAADAGRGYGAGPGRFMASEGQPDDRVASTPEAARWDGWGTALKPAWEPAVLARKPLAGTVARNVLEHGTGALNIDGCRIGTSGGTTSVGQPNRLNRVYGEGMGGLPAVNLGAGRWPANVALDDEAAAMLDAEVTGLHVSGNRGGTRRTHRGFTPGESDGAPRDTAMPPGYQDPHTGPSRFFYTAKASKKERGEGNTHPTVKPLALMRWIVRLVTPPGGLVLDPFAGSGTTGVACRDEGFPCILIEREQEYVDIIRRRLDDPQLRIVA